MNIENLSINAIRMLGMDAINKANSGHPGMVLGSAPMMYTLYTKFMNATPKDSNWINRDRFVLASGHASMLLYATLHFAGYKVSIDDIKNFRQLGSLTPGHPEFGHTDGVDATSGPLGQGIAHAVGMALAEKYLANKYNKDDFKVFDHYTYVICGDGDIEEGITQEVINIAGINKLNKLIVLYDNNDVTLDGGLELSSIENTKMRFQASNWNVINIDGKDLEQIEKAIKKAKKSDKPTLIIAKTIIGEGSVNENTCKVHGAPLGVEDTNNMKAKIGWNYGEFEVPNEVYEHYNDTFYKRGLSKYKKWKSLMRKYKEAYPALYNELMDAINNVTKEVTYPTYNVGDSLATRAASGKAIQEIGKVYPNLVGGAADVESSVKTHNNNSGRFPDGNNLYFGIREFAMSCAQTGMLLHGGVRSYVGSFLVFVDYFKASIRTAALMNLPAIYILTHDSIAVGEDGPTHQPIEQIPMLNMIPNVTVFRPANGIETNYAWDYAIKNTNGPVALCLSRQNLRVDSICSQEEFNKGAYVAYNDGKEADVTLLCSGSEVNLCVDTAKELEKEGKIARVVSMPSMQLFDKLKKSEQKRILGNKYNKIISVFMGNGDLYYKYGSKVYDIKTFGASAPAKDVMAHFNFTKDKLKDFILK